MLTTTYGAEFRIDGPKRDIICQGTCPLRKLIRYAKRFDCDEEGKEPQLDRCNPRTWMLPKKRIGLLQRTR